MNPPAEPRPLKLVYFPVRGRIEPARLLLELAGAAYEFEAITLATWASPDGKQRFLGSTPFGQLPLLHDGPFVLTQSMAIGRYLAQQLGFHGNTAQQNARVDEVTDIAGDLLLDLGLLCWDPRFAERRAEHAVGLRQRLGTLQAHFGRSGADAQHWVLPGRYTLGDIWMAYALETLLPLHPGLLEEFPKLYHAMQTFFATAGVREYVRSPRRPRTYTVPMAQFGGQPEQTHHWY